MEDIRLRSHDGTDEVWLRIAENSAADGSNVALSASFRMHGLAYDRPGSVSGEPITDRDRKDYDVTLPQIVVAPGVLPQLSEALSQWRNDFELFQIIVSDANEQKMTFSLELLDDFICSCDRPVAVVRYSVHRIALESRFVVDSTTLGEFENGVNRALAGLT